MSYIGGILKIKHKKPPNRGLPQKTIKTINHNQINDKIKVKPPHDGKN